MEFVLRPPPRNFNIDHFKGVVPPKFAAALGYAGASIDEPKKLRALIEHVLKTRHLPLVEQEWALRLHRDEDKDPEWLKQIENVPYLARIKATANDTVASSGTPSGTSAVMALVHAFPLSLKDRWYEKDELVTAMNEVHAVKAHTRRTDNLLHLNAGDIELLYTAKPPLLKRLKRKVSTKVYIPVHGTQVSHDVSDSQNYDTLFGGRQATPSLEFDRARQSIIDQRAAASHDEAARSDMLAAKVRKVDGMVDVATGKQAEQEGCAGVSRWDFSVDVGFDSLTRRAQICAGMAGGEEQAVLRKAAAAGFLPASSDGKGIFCLMFLDSDAVTFRSKDCTATSDCEACRSLRNQFSSRKHRAAVTASQDVDTTVGSQRTNHTKLVLDPAMAKKKIVDQAATIKRQQRYIKRLERLNETMLLEKQTEEEARSTAQIFVAADEVLKMTPAERGGEEVNAMAEWHKKNGEYDHAQVWEDIVSNSKTILKHGNRGGVRYSVASVRYGLALLNKVGVTAYETLRKVHGLPTHRHLGKWRSAASDDGAGPMFTNIHIARTEMEVRGAWNPENRVGALCFDAMTLKEVQYRVA